MASPAHGPNPADHYRDFLKALHEFTEHSIELRACANTPGGSSPASHMSRGGNTMLAWVQRSQRDDNGIFFGVATRRKGSPTGRRQDLAELPALWVDIDTRKMGIAADEAVRALQNAPLPPSAIVSSGNGVHGYWFLNEAVTIDVESCPPGCDLDESLVTMLKQLASTFAGDPKVCDLARIMRLPGTMNTKAEARAANEGEAIPVVVVSIADLRYDLTELEDWLDMQRPLLEAPDAIANAKPQDPFAVFAKSCGFRIPLDVHGALEAMTLGGLGDNSIHQTQLRVSAHLVTKGAEDEEIVQLLMGATARAAGMHWAHWNQRAEERNLRRMIADARVKFPVQNVVDMGAALVGVAEARAGAGEADRVGGVEGLAAGASVVSLSAARETKKRAAAKPAGDGGGEPLAGAASASDIEETAQAVILKWEEENGKLLVDAGEFFTYRAGTWTMFDEGMKHDLRCEVNGMTTALGKRPSSSQLSSVLNYILTTPKLRNRNMIWNANGYLVCDDGTLDPETGAIHDHDYQHYATTKVRCSIRNPGTTAFTDAYMQSAFGNVAEPARSDIIETLWEWLGLSLIKGKRRELRKALIVYGPSMTGKTRLANLVRNILGGVTTALPLAALEGKFGASALIGKSGWISDDGIGEGDDLASEMFKRIVTGERESVARKNRSDWEGCFDMPIMFTCNALPRIKDKSDGVYSRCLLLPMTNVQKGATNSNEVDAGIAAETGAIVLKAVAAAKRAMRRGKFEVPEMMARALAELKADNNPLEIVLKDAFEADEFTRIHRRDLRAIVAGCFLDLNGPSRFEHAPQTILKQLRVMFPTLAEVKNNGERYISGVRATDAGLSGWRLVQGQYDGATRTFAQTATQVNGMSRPRHESF